MQHKRINCSCAWRMFVSDFLQPATDAREASVCSLIVYVIQPRMLGYETFNRIQLVRRRYFTLFSQNRMVLGAVKLINVGAHFRTTSFGFRSFSGRTITASITTMYKVTYVYWNYTLIFTITVRSKRRALPPKRPAHQRRHTPGTCCWARLWR